MELNLYSTPLLFAFIHGLIYIILLVVRGSREQRLSDYILAGLLFCGITMILPYMLSFGTNHILWTDLLFFPTHPGFLVGPLLYFYLISRTNSEFIFSRPQLIHFLPFIVYIIYHLVVFGQGRLATQDWIADVHLRFIHTPINILMLTSNFYYLYKSVDYYRSYRSWLNHSFSNTTDIDLSWFRNLLWIVGIGISLSWVFDLLRLNQTQNWWEYFATGIMIYIISISGYHTGKDVYLNFSTAKSEENKTVDTPSEPDQLDPRQQHIQDKLTELIETKKVYLRPDLTLQQLATSIKATPTEVSAMINSQYQKNFNQFINDYRVTAFKYNAVNPDNSHLSLLAIAYDSGFNSKATFNRVFKEKVGMSPRAYVKSFG